MKNKQIARYALLIALAMVLSWLESMVPVSTVVPGVKLGLAWVLHRRLKRFVY